MKIKKKDYAPFGVGSKRFAGAGLHPGFGNRSGTRSYPLVGPGSYDLAFSEKSYFKNEWSRSLETEEFSKNLGFFAPDFLKQKIRAKECNGPGWHEHVSPAKSVKITFPKAARFVEPRKVETPGPGFYRRKGRFVCRKAFSGVPTFERENFRKREPGASSQSRLPPNQYRVSGFVDGLLTKVVSKRGPYDLFTGPRDETTLYGHFRKSAPKHKTDALYNFPSGADMLKSRENEQKGKFMRCGRDAVPPMRSFSKKNPDDPGPAHYELPSFADETRSESPYPFGTSLLYARPQTKIGLKPGPGRYGSGRALDPVKGNGWTSSFVSKTKRGGPFPDKKSWFEPI